MQLSNIHSRNLTHNANILNDIREIEEKLEQNRIYLEDIQERTDEKDWTPGSRILQLLLQVRNIYKNRRKELKDELQRKQSQLIII